MKKKASLLETFLPLIILLGSIIFIVVNIISSIKEDNCKLPTNKWVAYSNDNTDVSDFIADIEPITTPVEYYNNLMEICTDYIESNTLNYSVVDSNIDIDEKTFVDGKHNEGNKVNNPVDFELEPIYFQDKLLVRYENDIGKIKGVLIERLSFNNGGFLVLLNDNDFDNYKVYDVFEKEAFKEEAKKHIDYNLVYFNEYAELKDIDMNSIIIPKSYLNDISSIFCRIIQTSAEDVSEDLRYDIHSYFTEEGYQNIVVDDSYIKSGSDVSVSYIIIGSSDIDTLKYNRVFLKLLVDDVDVNIVVKLNDAYKIYDIDIF